MIQTKTRPLTDKLAFDESSTKKLDIPLDNDIRRMSLLVNIDIVKGTTAATTLFDSGMGILPLLKKIRLVMNGDDNKFNLDGTKWYIVETMEKGTTPQLTTLPTPSVTATYYVLLQADFASFRQDLSDISALLPAPDLASLTLEVDYGKADGDLWETINDTIITDATSGIEVTLTEVFETEKGKTVQSQVEGGYIDIREGTDVFDVTKVADSYDTSVLTETIEPTPAKILTHLLLTREDTTDAAEKNRVDDVLTHIRVENVKGDGERIFDSKQRNLQFDNKTEYGIETIITGAYYIDWIDQRRGGLRNFETEAVKWKFLANAPDSTETDQIEVYTRYVAGT